MKDLFDTNAVIALMKGDPTPIAKLIESCRPLIEQDGLKRLIWKRLGQA